MISNRSCRPASWLSILLSVAFLSSAARAVYVREMPVKLMQPDGQEIQAYVTGDEFYRSVHDRNGYVIVPDAKGECYVYAVKVGDTIGPSAYVVGKSDPVQLKLVPNVRPSEKILAEYRAERLSVFAAPSRSINSGTPTTTVINNIVIFVRFSGESEFGDPITTYQGLFTNFGTGVNSMRAYYREASYNLLDVSSTFYPAPSGGMVVSTVDSHPRGYYRPWSAANTIGYTNNTERNTRHTALLKNAAAAIAGQVPADLDIDEDDDGNVDDVCYMFSGTSDNWADLLWPCCGALSGDTVYIRGKRVWTFNQQFRDWMFGSRAVGVLAHEMFHALGAPDLYHYREDQQFLTPAGPWDLMENDRNPPQHMTAYMKYKYGGWIGAIPQITTAGTYTLHPITSSTNNCYKIASPNSATEYFVVEYRRKTGTFESSIPGSGLIVYRINPAYNGNADGPPDELYIYRPGGTTDKNGTVNSANYSEVVGRTQINDYTNPKSFLSSGANGGLDISNVGAPGDTITFQIGINQALTPSLSPDGGVYATGQTVTVTCATPGATIRYTTNGSEPTVLSPVIASGGTISVGSTQTVKAKAWATGLNPSFTKSAKYAIQNRVYVDFDSPGPTLDGTSWATAFHLVQDAIDVANAGVDVWVASGTYVENITMKDDVSLYGGFRGTETALSQRNWVKYVTTLDGGGDGTVVTIPSDASSSTRLEGFTIRNGIGTVGWDGKRTGGGIRTGYAVEARIAFNIIKSNSADSGGGIFCDDMAKAQIYNNVIHSNTATDGAGIHCHFEAYTSIVGNTIAYNTGSGNGGAIYLDDIYSIYQPTIKNNMIAWNSSGIYVDNPMSAPVVQTNCLWGNTAYAYQGIPDQTGSNGNISAYPIFADSAAGDFHLRPGSGGIDVGSTMNLPLFTDRDGGDRAWDGNQDGTVLVDCGAYEFRRYYVKYDSPGVQDASSWTKALHTIQPALDAAVWPDEVWVARGTYNQHITLKDGVALYGGFAGTETSLGSRFWWQNETVLDGAGAPGSVVIVPVYAGPATRLDGFTVMNGSATNGGGLWCGSGSSAAIANNKIGPNNAAYGAGVYCDYSGVLLANNLFTSNTASVAGGAMYLSYSPATVSYNTIVANTAPGGGGGIVCYHSDPAISSNIVAFNSQGVYGVTASPTFSNNDVYGNAGGDYSGVADPTGAGGNLSADPRFLGRSDGDYHLTDGSPCIDTARHTDRPISDLDGRGRSIDGDGSGTGLADIGAYEFRRVYVKWDSSGGFFDGSAWPTAYHTVTDGLNAARSGDEIWVAGGTYNERITLRGGAALYGGFSGSETSRIRRNWPVNETILDAGAGGRVVMVPAGSKPSTRIDGFTLRNGRTTMYGGGIYIDQQSRACVENNRIIGNSSSGVTSGCGGGIYSYIASPTIVNNVIAGNSATGSAMGTYRGGGVCLSGAAPTVINNTIIGNSANYLKTGGDGGGLYLESTSAVLRNNIVAFNSSGICKNTAGAPALDHNDVYGNTSYNYSNLAAGSGDISSDPLFVSKVGGDYHLLAGSHCIDRGAGTDAPGADLDGLIRPLDGDGDGTPVVDIGAYESPADLAGAKKSLADGQPVAFAGVSVTGCFPGDLTQVYVGKPDRSSGIRVDYVGPALAEGQIVSVLGVMATAPSGERYVNAADGSIKLAGGSLVLNPLGLTNRAMGGSASGLQRGVAGSSGPNNVGMLVKTWGRVTGTESGLAWLDDGSGVSSLLSPIGIRTDLSPSGLPKLAANQIVEITGISSIAQIGRGVYCSLLRPRQASDIVVLQTPVAYVYNSDSAGASEFKALLDSEGFPTDLIGVSGVATADLSRYALIILGWDSGSWTNSAAVANVNSSLKPVVGVETGGANFFGKLSLNIAVNSYYTGNIMMAMQSSSPMYHQPFEVAISPVGAVTVSTNASGWYGYKVMSPVPAGVEAFGSRVGDLNGIMLARESGRFLYWPFRDKPSLLTDDGRHLFINACWYALR